MNRAGQSDPDAHATGQRSPSGRRRFVQSKVYGQHEHRTANGVGVFIWERGGTKIARFRWKGRQPGVTLGGDDRQAEFELRELMNKLEADTFVPSSDPSVRRSRRGPGPVRPLTVPEFVGQFIQAKRKKCGRSTAETYQSRLQHVVDFWNEHDDIRRRYPLAEGIDDDFVRDLNNWLRTRHVTRNGR